MADPNTRQGKRTPVTLKIKFKSETLEQFIERYAVDVSQGGIFIRTKEPLAVGTQMRFEFQLRDASPLIAGEGTVVWTRENDPSRPAIAPGMGVRFDRLAEGSQTVLERILAEKAKQAPQRSANESSKPPMFTDTPTRVAPAPVQEALLGKEEDQRTAGGRKRPDSFGDQGTPLPRPMPFHSDADEFPEEAFEEATKVRALDELIAQTADQTATATAAKPSADELAARRSPRADSTLADPPRPGSSSEEPAAAALPNKVEAKTPTPADRDSAPGLPSPPEAERKLTPSTPPEASKTKLGIEAPKAPVRPTTPSTPPATSPAPQRPVAKDAVTKATGMRAVAAEPKAPEATEKSGAPMLLLLLLLLAAGGAAVWFFVLRPTGDDDATTKTGPGSNVVTNPGSGSAMPNNGSAGSAGSVVAMGSNDGSAGSAGSATTNNGSAGSAVAMTGSNTGSAGSAAPPPPAAEIVETLIAAAGADKAMIEVIGTDQNGPAPLKAKLEKGKAYKARVQAPGYVMQEIDIKGGEKAQPKLVAKPRIITITTEPPGVAILVDGGNTGKTTPAEITLSKAQSAKKSVRVQLRKGGWKTAERMIDTAKYTEDADKMIATIDAKLDKAPVVQNTTNNNTNTNTTIKTGSNGSAGTTTGSAGTTTGSAGTTTGSGSTTGSAEKPAGSGSAEKPAGSGSAEKPAGTGSAGSGTTQTPKPGPGSSSEPEPDFVKRLP